MSRYSDQIRDEYGRTVPKVSIYVYKWDAYAQVAGDLETLTDDLSAPLANPLTSDADGIYYFNSPDGQKLLEYHFGGKVQERTLTLVGALPVPQATFAGLFINASALTIPVGMDLITTTGYSALDVGAAIYTYDAAVNSAYVAAHPLSSFIEVGGRGFRLDHEQDISLLMFGAVADDTGSAGTDNLPAWNAAMALLQTMANAGSNLAYHTSQKLLVPAGDYYFSGTANLKLTTLTVEGDGSFYYGPGTNFRFPAGCHGIVVNAYNTEAGVYDAAAADPTSPRFRGADFSIIRNIRVVGPSSGSGDWDGIHLSARALVDRCCTKGWARAGVAVIAAAGSGGATEGNANNWQVLGGRHEYNKVAGLYVEGADANAGWAQGVDCAFNGQYGIYDNSFLGNTYIACHTEYNGLKISGYEGTTTNPGCNCAQGGYYYTVQPGQAVGASTNAPPAGAYDNTYWAYYGNGVANSDVPAYSNGMSLVEGGAYYAKSIVAGTIFIGAYVEGGQSPAKGNAPAMFIGGFLTGGLVGTAAALANHSGLFTAKGYKVENTDSTGTSSIQVGGSTDLFATLLSSAGGSANWILEYAGGYLKLRDGSGRLPIAINATNGKLYTVDTEDVFKVNGTQVVAAQRTGWTTSTGTPSRGAFAAAVAGTVSAAYVQAEAQASRDRIAALEARLIALEADARAHGLIN